MCWTIDQGNTSPFESRQRSPFITGIVTMNLMKPSAWGKPPKTIIPFSIAFHLRKLLVWSNSVPLAPIRKVRSAVNLVCVITTITTSIPTHPWRWVVSCASAYLRVAIATQRSGRSTRATRHLLNQGNVRLSSQALLLWTSWSPACGENIQKQLSYFYCITWGSF